MILLHKRAGSTRRTRPQITLLYRSSDPARASAVRAAASPAPAAAEREVDRILNGRLVCIVTCLSV